MLGKSAEVVEEKGDGIKGERWDVRHSHMWLNSLRFKLFPTAVMTFFGSDVTPALVVPVQKSCPQKFSSQKIDHSHLLRDPFCVIWSCPCHFVEQLQLPAAYSQCEQVGMLLELNYTPIWTAQGQRFSLWHYLPFFGPLCSIRLRPLGLPLSRRHPG